MIEMVSIEMVSGLQDAQDFGRAAGEAVVSRNLQILQT
jgi:hypothetical protein